MQETSVMAPNRDLSAVFDPHSIAVVGASNDPSKWGHWLAAGALRGAHRRNVYLVNRNAEEILGQSSFSRIGDLPESPELAVIAVPFGAFAETITEAVAGGTRAVIAINAGFAETGAAGLATQTQIVDEIRAAGAVLIGPNCLGVVDNTTDLQAAWLSMGDAGLPPGAVGLISQSGTIALDVAKSLSASGLGISRFASLGNQADVTISDVIRSMVAHTETKLIALYCEEFRDGREFLRAAQAAISAGKPVVLLAAGGSEASARAAMSHTGSMTSDGDIVRAVCESAGIAQVATPTELADLAEMMLRAARPRGRRIAVVSNGGGHAVVSADVLSDAGLVVPAFTSELRSALTDATDPTAGTGNPVDLATSNVDPFAFERVVRAIIGSGEVDSILLTGSFGNWDGHDEMAAQESQVGRSIAIASADAGMPLVLQTILPESVPAIATREAGAPVFRDIDRAARALARATDAAQAQPIVIPEVPAQVSVAADDGYFAVRRLLSEAGIEFPAAEAVDNVEEALVSAARIGYPVVLKAVSLLHKSDSGGVALNLKDDEGLVAAFQAMRQAVPDGQFAVEAMATSFGMELLVGCRQDARFGPVLTIGFGGIYAELLNDVVHTLAPASDDEVTRMLHRLRGASLLHGARGKPPLDIRAAAAAAAQLSVVAATHHYIGEIEINPLLVHAGGALALDARMIVAPGVER